MSVNCGRRKWEEAPKVVNFSFWRSDLVSDMTFGEYLRDPQFKTTVPQLLGVGQSVVKNVLGVMQSPQHSTQITLVIHHEKEKYTSNSY